jgi:hypothetical protein
MYLYIYTGDAVGKVDLSHYTRKSFTESDKFIHGAFRVIGKKSGITTELL